MYVHHHIRRRRLRRGHLFDHVMSTVSVTDFLAALPHAALCCGLPLWTVIKQLVAPCTVDGNRDLVEGAEGKRARPRLHASSNEMSEPLMRMPNSQPAFSDHSWSSARLSRTLLEAPYLQGSNERRRAPTKRLCVRACLSRVMGLVLHRGFGNSDMIVGVASRFGPLYRLGDDPHR